jgi:tight adherence protein B
VTGAGPGSMTPATWAAVLCWGAASWAAWSRDEVLRRATTLIRGANTRGAGREAGGDVTRGKGTAAGVLGPAWRFLEPLRRRLDRRVGQEALCLPAGLALALLSGSLLPAFAGAAAVPLCGRWLRGRRRRAAVESRSLAVGQLCSAVAGDVRAGLSPHAALAGAVRYAGWPDRPDLVESATLLLAAARFGGDVPTALRTAGRQPGTEGLAAVAACWQVAVDGGAGLANGLDRIADALRAERDQREDLRAQLAGPRSTAVMLALLPAVGVALGTGLGADPLRVLLDTPAGLGCLVVGGLLEWAGLAWTAWIVRTAEQAS